MSKSLESKPFEVGQVWKRYGTDYGDIIRYQVVFVKSENCIIMNCATLSQTVIHSEDQRNSFTFDCELTTETPRLDKQTLNRKGY